MLWSTNTMVQTFRIDKHDWLRFVEILKRNKGEFARPSEAVRNLVIEYTRDQFGELPIPATEPEKLTPAKKPATKKPATKKAKSNRAR